MTKVVYVKFVLFCHEDADLDEVVYNLDYTIKHPDIIEVEFREAEKKE